MPILFAILLSSLANIQDQLEDRFDQFGEDDLIFNVEKYINSITKESLKLIEKYRSDEGIECSVNLHRCACDCDPGLKKGVCDTPPAFRTLAVSIGGACFFHIGIVLPEYLNHFGLGF